MRRAMIVLTALLLLIGACGGSEDPKQRLVEGINGLSEGEGVSMTITLQSNVGSLQALAKEDGDRLEAEDAQKILDSSVELSSKNAQQPKDAAGELALNLAGKSDAVELKFIGDSLFVRADVAQVVETLGQDPSVLQRLSQQASASGLPFLQAALRGEWLRLDGVSALAAQFGGPQAQPQSQEQQQRTIREFAETMKQQARVQEGDEEGPGDHLVSTINLRDFYRSLLDLAQRLGQRVPQAALPSPDEVPNESIELDTWVEDDSLRQVEFDFLQLDKLDDDQIPAGVNELALRVGIEEFTGEVSRPQDAVEVDPRALFALFAPAQLGEGAKSAQTANVCARLKNAPPEVKRQFVQECPQFKRR